MNGIVLHILSYYKAGCLIRIIHKLFRDLLTFLLQFIFNIMFSNIRLLGSAHNLTIIMFFWKIMTKKLHKSSL